MTCPIAAASEVGPYMWEVTIYKRFINIKIVDGDLPRRN